MRRTKQVSKRALAACLLPLPKKAIKKKRRPRVVALEPNVKRCLRNCWQDGAVWKGDKTLAPILSVMLQEGTNASRPVPPDRWQSASRECQEWTIGKNLGPRTEAGSFQSALRSTRAVRSQTDTIVGWWFRVIQSSTQARSVHSVDTLLKDVDKEAAIHYILKINHELSRINKNSCKKDAPNRKEWYKVPDEMLREDNDDDLQQQEVHQRRRFTPPVHQDHQTNKRPVVLNDNAEPSDVPLEAVVDMGHDNEQGCVLYKCRWVGWGPDHDTWEPEANLRGASEAIGRYVNRPRSAVPLKAHVPPTVAEATKAPRKKTTSKKTTSKTPQKHKTASKTPAKAQKRSAPGSTPKTQTKKSRVTQTHEGEEREQVQQNHKPLPNAALKDKSKLVAGALIWVKYPNETMDLEWFQANVVIVAKTTVVPSASVVRVHFKDGQKVTLNFKGLIDAAKLHKCDPKKYEVFDWSSDQAAKCVV